MKTTPIDAIAESLSTDRLSRRTALGRLGRGGAAAAALTVAGGGVHRVAAADLLVQHGDDTGETGSTGAGHAADVVVQSSPHDDLPEVAAESTGRLRRLSDYDRGLWLETEDQWVSLRGEVFDVRAYGAVGDGVTDDCDDF